MNIIDSLVTIAMYFAVLSPVVLLAWWTSRNKRTNEGLRPLAAATVFFAVYFLLLLNVPQVGFFENLEFPWQNKLLAFALALLFVWLWRGLSPREVGLEAPVGAAPCDRYS